MSNKSFSSYGSSKFTSIDDERKNALKIAKQLREQKKSSPENKKNINDLMEKKKQLFKEIEEAEKIAKEKEKERITSITNDEIKKSLEIVKIQNQELKNKINSESSITDILTEINKPIVIKDQNNSDDIKNSLDDLIN